MTGYCDNMDTETLKLLLKDHQQGSIREKEDAEADLDRIASYLAAEVIKLRFEVNHGTSIEAQLRVKIDRLNEDLSRAKEIPRQLEKLLSDCVGVTRYFEVKRMDMLAELKASRREADINDWMDGDRKPSDYSK